MKNLVKKHWRLLLAVVAIPVGGRIFNHINVWFGIAIVLTASIYIIYQLIKFSEDETEF